MKVIQLLCNNTLFFAIYESLFVHCLFKVNFIVCTDREIEILFPTVQNTKRNVYTNMYIYTINRHMYTYAHIKT